MKFYLCLFSFIFLILACEKPADCIKSTGKMISKEINVTSFEKIVVHKGIGVVLAQGPQYKVEVRTGENLINDIEVTVENNILVLQDNTTCNWVRDYGETVVYITAPSIKEIYSRTEKNIVSDGVLTFPSLLLSASNKLDGMGGTGTGTGDYILQVNNHDLTINTNNVARFTISGQTQILNINVYEENGIVDTENVLANTINIYHRGSNKIVVHPIDALNGDLYNIGNVYSKTHPAIVNVNAHYQGQLIFL
jgi:hypothetical protein